MNACPHGFAIEVSPPDLARWAEGNTGVPHAWRFASGREGPRAMVVALTHGEELSGAIALDALLREGLLPARGSLSIAFANTDGLARWDPARPNAGFYVDRDMNRVWDRALLDGPEDAAELRRARALRPLVDEAEALLDLHSMQYPAPPMLVAGRLPKGRALAEAVGEPALVILDEGHRAGRRLRDYGPFDDPSDPRRAALVLEAGQHWLASSVPVARRTILRFLAALGMLPGNFDPGPATAGPRRTLQVTHTLTVTDPGFRFDIPLASDLEHVPRAGTEIGHDGTSPIRTPYDDCWLLMPVRRARMGTTGVRFCREVA